MSTSNQTTRPSSSNFTSIYNTALEEYKRLTGKDLHIHPFAVVFDVCNTPETVLNVFRRQAQAFEKFRAGEDKLMRWLNPTVHVLFTLSAVLGEAINLVSPLFLHRVFLRHLSLSHFQTQSSPVLEFSSR
jgi:hypothetical protein